MSLQRHLYTLALLGYLPLALAHLGWRGIANRGYWHRWGERFALTGPRSGAPVDLWLHAVSVGEVQAAAPVVERLLDRYPALRLLLTTTTPTGSDRVRALFGDAVQHVYVTYDLPWSVECFLGRYRPGLAVFMETELWPNTIAACAARGIPIVVANARLSERSSRGYGRFPALTREMLARITLIAAQNADDAARFLRLGAAPDRVLVSGSVKFDLSLPASLQEQAQVLRRHWGVDRGVWIAGSTHEGEEELILEAFARIRQQAPDTLLVLVPRHPERFNRVVALARRQGLRTAQRSLSPESCTGVQVYVGDTMGELSLFYAAADVAFVGGSLVDVGGHNMLEPAALGLPVVFGPHVFNFAEASRLLLAETAARQVRDSAELAEAVVELLGDANLRHEMGERGRHVIDANRGALERLIALLGPYLPGTAALDPVLPPA